VLYDIDPDDYQGSPGGITHQVRGSWKLRRCDEPAYTITATQYPYVINSTFSPDPDLHGVGEVDEATITDREYVKAVQTIDEIDVQTSRKGVALTLIGNAVPADLAEAVVSELPE
jgi:hypothetical protein